MSETTAAESEITESAVREGRARAIRDVHTTLSDLVHRKPT